MGYWGSLISWKFSKVLMYEHVSAEGSNDFHRVFSQEAVALFTNALICNKDILAVIYDVYVSEQY